MSIAIDGTRKIIGADSLSEEYFATLNGLLPGSTPIGAYAMGAVTYLALSDGLEPDRKLLYGASTVVTLYAVEVIYGAWLLGELRRYKAELQEKAKGGGR